MQTLNEILIFDSATCLRTKNPIKKVNLHFVQCTQIHMIGEANKDIFNNYLGVGRSGSILYRLHTLPLVSDTG